MNAQIRYKDTPADVRRMLRADYDGPVDIDDAQVQPDIGVEGCWLVTLPSGDRLLAYVGAHPLAPGFEEVE